MQFGNPGNRPSADKSKTYTVYQKLLWITLGWLLVVSELSGCGFESQICLQRVHLGAAAHVFALRGASSSCGPSERILYSEIVVCFYGCVFVFAICVCLRVVCGYFDLVALISCGACIRLLGLLSYVIDANPCKELHLSMRRMYSNLGFGCLRESLQLLPLTNKCL